MDYIEPSLSENRSPVALPEMGDAPTPPVLGHPPIALCNAEFLFSHSISLPSLPWISLAWIF